MTAGGYHTELRQSVFGWRAEFYRESPQHSRSTWAGVGTDVLPWRAVQIGALDVLTARAIRGRKNLAALVSEILDVERG